MRRACGSTASSSRSMCPASTSSSAASGSATSGSSRASRDRGHPGARPATRWGGAERVAVMQRPRLVERVRPSVGRSGPEFVAGHRAAARLVADVGVAPPPRSPRSLLGRPAQHVGCGAQQLGRVPGSDCCFGVLAHERLLPAVARLPASPSPAASGRGGGPGNPGDRTDSGTTEAGWLGTSWRCRTADRGSAAFTEVTTVPAGAGRSPSRSRTDLPIRRRVHRRRLLPTSWEGPVGKWPPTCPRTVPRRLRPARRTPGGCRRSAPRLCGGSRSSWASSSCRWARSSSRAPPCCTRAAGQERHSCWAGRRC